jgi:hypothetical protein
MTMATTKTVMLSVIATLNVGVGTAMANGPDGSMSAHQLSRTPAAAMNASRSIHRDAGQLQSNSPEVNSRLPGIFSR